MRRFNFLITHFLPGYLANNHEIGMLLVPCKLGSSLTISSLLEVARDEYGTHTSNTSDLEIREVF